MATRLPLTERQRQVLALIVERIAMHGFAPTLREIGRHLQIASTNGVSDHIKALKRKGYLKQQGQKSRTLQPVRPNRRLLATSVLSKSPATAPRRVARAVRATALRAGAHPHRVPLLGRVAAGEPLLAVEQAEGEVTVDAAWASGGALFALIVVGDSMVEDNIFNGDIIVVQRRQAANAGDIVVVLIDHEATVKRYYPEGDRVRLQPANSRMRPIYLTAEAAKGQSLEVVGVVVGLHRRL